MFYHNRLSLWYMLLKVKNNNFFLFFLAVIILVFGTFIYISYRKDDYVIFSILRYFNINYITFRNINATQINTIEEIIIYNIPCGLWLLSWIIILGIIWKRNSKIFFRYSFMFLLFALTIEFLQIENIIKGTFDLGDVYIYLIFYLIGISFYYFRNKYEK